MTRAEWARRKGRSSSFIRKSTRFAIYARDNFDCVYCRSVFPPPLDGAGLHLDHVVPRSRGGSNDPSNLVTACEKCNTTRAAREGYKGIALAAPVRVVRERIRRQLRKPIDRKLGRWLAHFAAKLRRPVTVTSTGTLQEVPHLCLADGRRIPVHCKPTDTGAEMQLAFDRAVAEAVLGRPPQAPVIKLREDPDYAPWVAPCAGKIIAGPGKSRTFRAGDVLTVSSGDIIAQDLAPAFEGPDPFI